MPHTDLLAEVRAAVADGRTPGPLTRAALATTDDPMLMRRAGRVLAGLAPPADGPDDLRPLRVAVLATCTVGPLEHLLHATLLGAGARPTVELGEYGAFELTLATPGRTAADLVVCLLDESYFLPARWSAVDVDAIDAHLERRLADLSGLVAANLDPAGATFVLHTVPMPADLRDSLVSLRARAAVSRLWHRLNAGLLALAEEHPQVVVVDLVSALADSPHPARDERLHRYADLPYTDGALLVLAHQVRRVAQARLGTSRKVLALDLDNTLWGGVVGEVGAAGVQVAGLYPGNCYQELQRAAGRLRDQGVVLVLASKNDPDVVTAALTDHPDVLLRPDAFSVVAVGWGAKAANLRDAARSLGLAEQAFVFMDDSEFERGAVAAELPEVAVVSAAGDPAHLVRSLLRTGWFDVTDLTDTDLRRPALYRSRTRRGDFAGGFGSSRDYLMALDIEVSAEPVTAFTVARVAQLAARTNQFNLTGRRFDEATTAAMSADPGHLVASFSVSDRFGDEGIVGAVWVECGERVWRVLNAVLSCRVLGRGVELAMVGWLAGQASAAGATAVEATFVPSGRNGVAAGFLGDAGFAGPTNDDGADDNNGGGGHSLALDGTRPGPPSWIRLLERSGV